MNASVLNGAEVILVADWLQERELLLKKHPR
jgi:hypothetical protein